MLRYLKLVVGLLLLASGGSAAVFAQTVTPIFTPAPCPFEGPDLGLFSPTPEEMGFECGYVTVPEERANPDSPAIRLPVAILRATAPNAKPDPLFLAQGGPGGSAFDYFTYVVPNTSIAAERDIVIFNQRGTQYAEPDLFCDETMAATEELLGLPPEEGLARSMTLLAACYRRLEAEGINLSAYNSLENAADVEDIRQALGYDEYNFYGVSYGTLLGLHLMRNYPEHLRSVILDGVVPPNLNFIPKVAENEDRIYRELFRACNADPDCAAAYPNLEARLLQLVDNLNENPAIVEVTNPDTGKTVDVYLDGRALLDFFFQAFYLPNMYAIFPKIVSDLEQGNYFFVSQILPLFAFDQTFSEGMYYSVICAEDGDFSAELDTAGLLPPIAEYAPEDLQSYLEGCALWPVELLPPTVDDPVNSDIPTLLLSGRFDPITPPYFAEKAAESLPNAYHVVDPLGSHGVAFGNDCLNQIVQNFLNDPYRQPDASCLATREAADTVLPSAVTFPLLGPLSTLEASFLWQTGLATLFLLGVLSAFVVWPAAFLLNVARNRRREWTAAARRLRWAGRLLLLAFGGLAVLFVIGVVTAVVQVLFYNTAYLSVYSLPGTVRPFLFIPYLLLLLAAGAAVVAALNWRQKEFSLWSKLYYTFLALCAAGYVAVLAAHGLI